MVIVLLSSRAFHIHSRRLRPTGTNWTLTPVASMPSLLLRADSPFPGIRGGCNRDADTVEERAPGSVRGWGVSEPRGSGRRGSGILVLLTFGRGPPEVDDREGHQG